MIIREATLEDAKEISLLMQDTVKRVNAKDYSPEYIEIWKKGDTEEKVAQGIKDKDRFTSVAMEDDSIVGVGTLKGDEITAIYVSADHLGEGIGAKLLTYLEDRAFKKGIKKLRLDSSLTAFQFYKKKGFEKIKDSLHINSEGGKIPCIVMEKTIKE